MPPETSKLTFDMTFDMTIYIVTEALEKGVRSRRAAILPAGDQARSICGGGHFDLHELGHDAFLDYEEALTHVTVMNGEALAVLEHHGDKVNANIATLDAQFADPSTIPDESQPITNGASRSLQATP